MKIQKVINNQLSKNRTILSPLNFGILSLSSYSFIINLILIFSITLILDFQICLANTYYVSTSGNNSNPGTLQQPWKTPGYGSRQLQPGDTLMILSGTYVLKEYDADIITPPSGTSEAWITIIGDPNNRPILAGRDNLITAINLSGVHFVRIENLEITHDPTAQGDSIWFRDGLDILGAPSSHIILKDLYIHNIDEFGMNIQDVDDLQLINCRIEYAGFGALGGPAGESGGWRNVIIRNSNLSWSGHYYQGGDGSNRPYDRPDGFGIEPAAGPIIIENTIAEHNYGDGLDSKAANTLIRRCIVANNSCDGIKLWGNNSRIENTLIYGRGDGNPEPSPWAAIVIEPETSANYNYEIINVTVDDSIGHNYLMYVQYNYPDVPVNIIIRNTIFSGRGIESPIYIGSATNLIADHNLFYFPQNQIILTHGDSVYTSENISLLGEGNIYGDPLFIQTAWGQSGNYHLREGSPAINAGSNMGVPNVDLDGYPRDNQPDIGAYEYRGIIGVPQEFNQSTELYSLEQNYPNPFNSNTTISFSLKLKSLISLKIFDLLGREVIELASGIFESGRYSFNWNADGFTSGIYFYRLFVRPISENNQKSFIDTKKLLLIK